MKIFRDLLNNPATVYSVSHGGSIQKWNNVSVIQREIMDNGIKKILTSLVNGPFMTIDDLDSNKAGLTKSGNISIGWSHAVFLDVNDAAKLAEKMATTKYNNSMKAINKMRKTI